MGLGHFVEAEVGFYGLSLGSDINGPSFLCLPKGGKQNALCLGLALSL